MGCGTSRNRESRPNSPQPLGVDETGDQEEIKSIQEPEIQLHIIKEESGGFKSFKTLALTQTIFIQQIANPSRVTKGDSVDHLDLDWKEADNDKSRSLMNSFDEDDEGPEIVDLQTTFAAQITKNSTESQTDPVLEEVFDWDLSDRADCETQTTPPSRVNSTSMGGLPSSVSQDAIVQTDQRLVFLLHRSSAARIKHQQNYKMENNPVDVNEFASNRYRPPIVVDAACQTYVEMEEIGIQVDPSEFDDNGQHFRRRRTNRPFSNTNSSVPDDYSTDFFDDDENTVFSGEDGVVQASTVSGNHLIIEKKRRILKNIGAGYFKALNDSDFSDPDEILVVHKRHPKVDENSNDEFLTTDDGMDRTPTLYDAGFQVNTLSNAEPMAATASTRSRQKDISSPVGQLLQKSLHLNEDDQHVPHVSTNGGKSRSRKDRIDIGIQTDNDILTDESPDFQAKPPTTRKYELIGDDPDLFLPIDQKVKEISQKRYKSLKRIVKILISFIHEKAAYDNINDLVKVRALWRWTTENISYDFCCIDREMSTRDILKEKIGVCRQYVKIFSEMCELANIRVKCIRGFAKGYNYIPGTPFVPGEGIDHAWNAVFINGSWRLVDCTWGAGKTDLQGHNFKRQLDEHFFLTDPDELIYTHFPHDEVESNYDRWQLLEIPITLDEFNAMPLLTSMFFEYSLRLDIDFQCPIIVHESSSIVITAWEAVRYKFKFFQAHKNETDILNTYVLCYLKGRHQQVGHFQITPPEAGQYFLKVYAKPEAEITSEHDTLDHVATFLIYAQQVKGKAIPLPRCDLPWGVTKAFFETEARLVNQPDPIISMIGNTTKEFVLKTPKGPLLTLSHIYDADGNELVIDDDRGTKYTVLLNKRNPMPTVNDDETSLLPFITRRETQDKIVFLIDPPPKPGFYKLQIYARKKPKSRGRLKIPLVANFLVDYRLSGSNVSKIGGSQLAARTTSAATTAMLTSGRSSLVAAPTTDQMRSSSLNSKISNTSQMVRSESLSSGLFKRSDIKPPTSAQSKRGSLTSILSRTSQDLKVAQTPTNQDRSSVYRLSSGSKGSKKDLSEISVT